MTADETAAAPELDDETLAFAARLFDLARDGADGRADELAGHLDAGLSADLTNSRGDTLLLLAAYHQQTDTVRTLLAHGADPDRVNDKGQTALAAAVFRKDREIVRMLREKGASPSAGNPSAIATAMFFGIPEMLTLLQ
jgi:hypothetical protein